MNFGKVKWYGGYNNKKDCINDFGFIKYGEEEVFFHKNGIVKGSELDKYIESRVKIDERYNKLYVCFDLIKGKDEQYKAENITLFNEVSNEHVISILEEVFCNDNPIHIDKSYIYSKLDWNRFNKEEIFQILEIVKLDEELKIDLIKKRIDVCISLVVDNIKLWSTEEISHHAYNYLVEKYGREGAVSHIINELKEVESFERTKILNNLISIIDYAGISEEQAIMLIDTADYNLNIINEILKLRPEIVFKDIKICSMVNNDLIEYIVTEEVQRSDEKCDYLYKNCNADILYKLVRQFYIGYIIQRQDVLDYFYDEEIVSMINAVDFNYKDEEVIECLKLVLNKIEGDTYVQAAQALIEKLYKYNKSFNLAWWKVLKESIKVKNLIYLSNFWRDWKDKYREDITNVYYYEKESGSTLIVALLKYIVIVYSSNEDVRQGKFLDNEDSAHMTLMEAVRMSFQEGFVNYHAYNTLLNKCIAHKMKKKELEYFCEAKDWKNKNCIFCPRNDDKNSRGQACPYGNTFLELIDKGRGNYYRQTFAHFINNLDFSPDLTEVLGKENNIYTYTYRISAYVNRLNKMLDVLKCSKCGKVFIADLKYSKKLNARLAVTVYNCPESIIEEGHDTGIYVNFCLSCPSIIDSRRCEIQDASEYRLCMECGASKHYVSGEACPKCGGVEGTIAYGKRFTCINKECGYSYKIQGRVNVLNKDKHDNFIDIKYDDPFK